MTRKTVKILLEVTVRDYMKDEREDEGLTKEDCDGMAEGFEANDLAESIAHFIFNEADEIMAGSNSFVKIASVDASPQ